MKLDLKGGGPETIWIFIWGLTKNTQSRFLGDYVNNRSYLSYTPLNSHLARCYNHWVIITLFSIKVFLGESSCSVNEAEV